MMDARMLQRLWLRMVGGLCLAAVVVLAGCGGEEIQDPLADLDADQTEVIALIGKVSDYAGQGRDQLSSIFTREARPSSADVKKFKARYFDVDGDITITGTTASFPVKVGEFKSASVGTATWKASKDGGQWKLTDAPLP